ncbi:TetR/AcrR family transcriptional regulator [Rheinheimera oceanensis]|uniref:TetR/AcrR family transcriptional regulator n=1 Tax=Rheinheimera oceanensis TaxID=2817449 RepID=UPI001BFE8EF9|nr:TetR/AcrR family transcriptional regulator [Rheinheimera oceanensis]
MTSSALPGFTLLTALPEPTQLRSQQAQQRLLDAGEQLLADNAFEEASVTQIAGLASSSVGTFYRVLGDKDTLSLLLLQRFFQTTVSLIEQLTAPEQWVARPLADFVQTLTANLVDVYQGRRGVLRALILRASRDSAFRDKVHQLNEYIAVRIVAVFQHHQSEVHHPQPRKAMQAAVHIVLGALNQHTITGNLGHLSSSEVVEELSRILLAYLDIHD